MGPGQTMQGPLRGTGAIWQGLQEGLGLQVVPAGPEAEDQGGDYCSWEDKKGKGSSSEKGDGEGDQEAFKTDPSRLRTDEAGDTSSDGERDRGPQSQPGKQV